MADPVVLVGKHASVAGVPTAGMGLALDMAGKLSPSLLTGYPASAGKVLAGDGTWITPPGYEYAYIERTTNLTSTQTVVASADTLLTSAAVTFDGATKIRVEMFIPEVFNSTAANSNTVILFEDGSARAVLGRVQGAGTTQGVSLSAPFEFTPASGSRTYSARVIVNAGTGTFAAGSGASVNFVPAFLRLVKA